MVQTSRDTGFLEIATRQDLADFLGMPLKTLTGLAYGPGMRSYSIFRIEKRRHGEYRRIEAPNRHLKKVQRQLAKEFDEIYDPLPCVHGFLVGESIVENARGHVGKYAILKLDIKDFFPSITGDRVHGLFRSEPFCFPEKVAHTLTELVCFDHHLPQGAPTSPILSNFICHRMDKQLMSFASQHRLFYSRYADDMTFSSTSARFFNGVVHESETGEISLDKKLVSIIEGNGFTINQEKTHVARRSSRQMVNGIIVNEKCNFKRTDYQTLRRLFWLWRKRGPEEAGMSYILAFPQYAERVTEDGKISEKRLRCHIRGRLDFYTMVCSGSSQASLPLLRLWTWYHDRTEEAVPLILPERAVFPTECSYYYFDKDNKKSFFGADGTCFYVARKLITCIHVLYNDTIPHGEHCKMGYWNPLIEEPGQDSRVHYARQYDLAVFDIGDSDVDEEQPSLYIDASYVPQLGEKVVAYGYAAEHKGLRRIACHVVELARDQGEVRVDIPFIEGMSGGPVFNTQGKAIGFITRGDDPRDFMYYGAFNLFSSVSNITSFISS